MDKMRLENMQAWMWTKYTKRERENQVGLGFGVDHLRKEERWITNTKQNK